MARAFQCDRCGGFNTGEPARIVIERDQSDATWKAWRDASQRPGASVDLAPAPSFAPLSTLKAREWCDLCVQKLEDFVTLTEAKPLLPAVQP